MSITIDNISILSKLDQFLWFLEKFNIYELLLLCVVVLYQYMSKLYILCNACRKYRFRLLHFSFHLLRVGIHFFLINKGIVIYFISIMIITIVRYRILY